MKINLNTILIGGLIVFALLYLERCGRVSSLKDEVKIGNMNQKVFSDSIRNYKNTNGKLVYQRGILIASKKELKQLNSNLYKEIKDLKDNPKVIYQTEVVIKRDTTPIRTIVEAIDSDSYMFAWKYDTTYSKGNFQKISGSTLFDIDSIGPNNVQTKIEENSFGLSLTTGLVEGKETYEIFVKSNYPGFEVTSIEGSIIDKKMIRSNESQWVIGPQFGYGITLSNGSVRYGPTIGFGVTYNLNKNIKKVFRPFGL